MKRLVLLLFLCSVVLTGCGTVVVRGALNVNTQAVSGVVSIVHLTFADDDNGAQITVTVVTLLQSEGAQDLTFCGSQVNQFPLGTSVTARFTPGPTCASLVSVTVSR